MIRDMMTRHQLSKAKEKAIHYGNAGQMLAIISSTRASRRGLNYGMPTPKTGFFTGYWNCGAVAWQGRFENGDQVGMWKYTSPNGVDSCDEFYCNL